MPELPPPIAVFASFSGAGGVERMLVNLMRGFVDLGRPVDLLLADADSPHLERLPAAVRRIDSARDIRLGRQSVSPVTCAENDLVRCWRQRIAPGAPRSWPDDLRATDTRIVLRLGTNLSAAMAGRSALDRWLRYAPIRQLYPSIDQIVAVSNGVADDTTSIARYPRARISVIRNPVVTPELTPGRRPALPASLAERTPRPTFADHRRRRAPATAKGFPDPDPGLCAGPPYSPVPTAATRRRTRAGDAGGPDRAAWHRRRRRAYPASSKISTRSWGERTCSCCHRPGRDHPTYSPRRWHSAPPWSPPTAPADREKSSMAAASDPWYP